MPSSVQPSHTHERSSVLILGLDGAGKVSSFYLRVQASVHKLTRTVLIYPCQTTFLENVKTQYNKVEGIHPDKIGPTVGLNSA